MNIFKKLLFVVFLPVITSTLLSLIFYFLSELHESHNKDNKILDSMLTITAKLRIHTIEYKEFQYERMRNQWLASHEQLKELAQSIDINKANNTENEVVNLINLNSSNILLLFNLVIKNEKNNHLENPVYNEVKERTNGQLLSTIDSIDTNILKLKTLSNEKFRNQGYIAFISILIIFIIVIILSLTIGLIVYRNTIKAFSDLQKNRSRVHLLLNSTAEAIFGIDANNRCTFVNASCLKILKHENNRNLIGKPISQFLRCSEENSGFVALTEELLNEMKIIHNECVIINSDSSSGMVIEYWSHPIIENDKYIGAVITFLDITNRKIDEENIRKNTRLLADAESLAHVGSWEKDFQSDTMYWSDEFYRIFELDPESTKPNYLTYLKRIHPDDREKIDLAYKESIDNHSAYRINHRILLPDGRIKYALEHCETEFDDSGKPLRTNGTVQDITEMANIEQQLRRSQKMDALGKLTGGIAHDYNNLLGIIIGYSKQLNDNIDKKSELSGYVDHILQAAYRGAVVTKKLLSFSRQKASETEILLINTLLQEQRIMLEKTLTSRLRLHYDLDHKLWPIELECAEFENAILNLCINAMHAIKESGDIFIRTSNCTLDDVLAKNLCLPPGDYVLLSLKDTGSGMDDITKEKVFDPFFSTKGENGTGLGLSQVYGFVERSCGAIKIYSELDLGTQFDIYFPRSVKPLSNRGSKQRNNTENLQGSESLLIVDDEQAMIDLLANGLKTFGYKTLSANDGIQAIEVLKNNKIDLVVSDVIMPNMGGYQLTEHIQKNYPEIPVQLVSGYADDEKNSALEENYRETIIFKPYETKDLLTRIRSLLDNAKALPIISHSEQKTRILVIDDDENIRLLYQINLNSLGYQTLMAEDGESGVSLFKKSLDNDEPINVVIVDLSLPGGIGGCEIAEKLKSLNKNVKVIVSSGHSVAPEMTHCEQFGFDGSLDKDFNKQTIKFEIARVLGIPSQDN